MPVILSTNAEIEWWMTAPIEDALKLQRPLPDGAVDIQAVMRFLAEKHFTGPIVVEQDVAENAAETPLQLATRNFHYMQQIA